MLCSIGTHNKMASSVVDQNSFLKSAAPAAWCQLSRRILILDCSEFTSSLLVLHAISNIKGINKDTLSLDLVLILLQYKFNF